MSSHLDSEILPDGPGWHSAVRELIYRLEVFGGYWAEDSRALAALLGENPLYDERGSFESLVKEKDVLDSLTHVLSSIENHGMANLSKPRQAELKALLRRAIKETEKRLKVIPSALESHERATRAVQSVLDNMNPRERDSLFSEQPEVRARNTGAEPVASTPNKGGRPRSPEVEEVQAYLYKRWIKGDKLATIRAGAAAQFGRDRAPKEDAHVTREATRYAEKNSLPSNRKK